MKIVIENQKFDFEVGCGLLKLKHETPPFEEVKDIWDSIKPLSFVDIAKLKNLEERRIGILYLGLDRIVKEVNPTLISKRTLEKTTNFFDKDGNHITKTINDTYELFEVSGEVFSQGLDNWRRVQNSYYVKCKDTSTDREYLIWVDLRSVAETNGLSRWSVNVEEITPIQCIAWTIQTNVPKGNIEKIIRQGDCVLVKPKNPNDLLSEARHLTEEEYIELLVAES
jgi:hypothetical protein